MCKNCDFSVHYPPTQSERLEKLEKALSEEMARTREMDDILAGVVKRVGRDSNTTNDPAPPYGEKREPMIDELALYDMCRKAGEPVDAPEYCGGPGTYSAQRMRKAYESLIDKGDLIRKDNLLKWLDAEIAMAEENLKLIVEHNGGLKPLVQFETILAAHKAVKAHITGE
jgi:hypothetical protein